MDRDDVNAAVLAAILVVAGSLGLSGAALLALRGGSLSDLAPRQRSAATSTAPVSLPPVQAPTATAVALTPAPTASPPAERRYTVLAGDGLESIATKLGVTSGAIAQRNQLVAPYTLEPGQVLMIPAAP